MALRFRRSVRLAPGIRLNFGKRGVSLSAGVRGASMTFGRRGTHGNVGVPGTGISFREKVGGDAGRVRQRPSPGDSGEANTSVQISLEDDGTVRFLDADGQPLSLALERAAKRQKGEYIREWLRERVDEINDQLNQLETIHFSTPSPDNHPQYEPVSFTEPEPSTPTHKPLGLSGRLFSGVRRKVEKGNAELDRIYMEDLDRYQQRKRVFEAQEQGRQNLVKQCVTGNPDAMQEVLEARLKDIEWPRETNVSFEVREDGEVALIDVDLPEIEEFPTETASVPSRGWKVSVKKLSDSKLRQVYMRHVHGIGFRLIGETFAALPAVDTIVLSAYSQRADKATGQITDEYLYSVKVVRPEWAETSFERLTAIDVVESLSRFELKRNMTKTGVFKPIEPLLD